MPQLDFSTYPSQIFWLLVSFTSLFLLIKYLVVPRLQEIFDSRWERKDNNIQRSLELKEEAEALLKKIENTLEKAENEAHHIMLHVEEKFTKEKEAILEDFNKKAAIQIKEAEDQILALKKQCYQDLPTELAMLTEIAREKVYFYHNKKEG